MVKVKTGSCFDRSIKLQLGKDTTVRLTGRGSNLRTKPGIRFSLIPLNNNYVLAIWFHKNGEYKQYFETTQKSYRNYV